MGEIGKRHTTTSHNGGGERGEAVAQTSCIAFQEEVEVITVVKLYHRKFA